MQILEIIQPLIIILSLGHTVDMSNTQIAARAPMECVVKIKAGEELPLEGSIKLGVIDAANIASNGLCIENVSISQIDVRAIRGAVQNGMIMYQSGSFGTFANQIRIGSIRHNGENGLLVISPTGGVYGVQGNQIQIGQLIFNKHSGIAIFGAESAWNRFDIGVSEWNGLWGIYDDGRENIYTVANTNTNGIAGLKAGDKSIVSGHFSDSAVYPTKKW